MRTRLLRASIFLKILAVFAGALFVIGGYFWVTFLLLDWEESARAAQAAGVNYTEYILTDLGSPPDSTAARALVERLAIRMRIDGAGIDWASDAEIPPFADVELPEVVSADHARAGLSDALGFSVEVERDGYRYLVVPQTGRFGFDNGIADTAIDALFMAAVLVGVFLLIRRILRPIRELSEGVDRIRGGEPHVEMNTRRGDELGRLIVSFNEMARAVRERIRARDQLLLDVSHELRSPLTRMKVALDLMPDSPAKESILEDIEDTEGMISGLLETERMDSRHGGLDRTRTDMARLIREVVESHADTKPGIDLQGDEEPAYAFVDTERIRVLVGNLLSNALKYSPEAGTPVRVSIREADLGIAIAVEDHGIGIAPEDLVHVFEPFFRADPSRSKDTGGYGLGLSLAKRIAEAHGGGIEARSASGRGTSVRVILPAGPDEVGSARLWTI